MFAKVEVGPIFTLLLSLHILTNVRLVLNKNFYCENITAYIKSHINSKYVMNFFLKFSQEMNQKLY